jgi:hypothetical protein
MYSSILRNRYVIPNIKLHPCYNFNTYNNENSKKINIKNNTNIARNNPCGQSLKKPSISVIKHPNLLPPYAARISTDYKVIYDNTTKNHPEASYNFSEIFFDYKNYSVKHASPLPEINRSRLIEQYVTSISARLDDVSKQANEMEWLQSASWYNDYFPKTTGSCSGPDRFDASAFNLWIRNELSTLLGWKEAIEQAENSLNQLSPGFENADNPAGNKYRELASNLKSSKTDLTHALGTLYLKIEKSDFLHLRNTYSSSSNFCRKPAFGVDANINSINNAKSIARALREPPFVKQEPARSHDSTMFRLATLSAAVLGIGILIKSLAGYSGGPSSAASNKK